MGKGEILQVKNKVSKEIIFSKRPTLVDTLPLRRRKRKKISEFGKSNRDEIDLPLKIIIEDRDWIKDDYNKYELNVSCINGACQKIIFVEDYKIPINWESPNLDTSNFLLITHLTYDEEKKELKEKLLMEVSLEKLGSKLFNSKTIDSIYEHSNSEDDIIYYLEEQWKAGVKHRFKTLESNLTDVQSEKVFPYLMRRLFELAPSKMETVYMQEGRLFFDETNRISKYKKVKCNEFAGRQRANIPFNYFFYKKLLGLDRASRKKRHIKRRERIQENYVNTILSDLNFQFLLETEENFIDYIVSEYFIKYKEVFFNLKDKSNKNMPTEAARAKFAYTIYLLRNSKQCGKEKTDKILEKVFEFLKNEYYSISLAEKAIKLIKQDIFRISKKGFFELDEIDIPNMPRISLLLNPPNNTVFSEKGITIKILTKDNTEHTFKEFIEGKIELDFISKILYKKGKKIIFSSKILPHLGFDVISDILPYDEMRVKTRELFKLYIDQGNRLNILECCSDEREFKYKDEIFTGREIYNLVRRVYYINKGKDKGRDIDSVKAVLEDIIESEYEKGPLTKERKKEIQKKYSYKYIGPDLKKARHLTGYAAEIFILAGIKEILKNKFPNYKLDVYFPADLEGLYNKKGISTNGKGSQKRKGMFMHPDFIARLINKDGYKEVFIESKLRRKLNSPGKLEEKIIEQYEGIDSENVLVIVSTWQGIERPELDNPETFKNLNSIFNTYFTNELFEILKNVNFTIGDKVINLGEEYKKFIENPAYYITEGSANFNLIKNEFRIHQLLPGFE